MTRDNTKTLAWLRANAGHTHPGQAGKCTDWTCDEFLDAISSLMAANEALRFENATLITDHVVRTDHMPPSPKKKAKK